MQETTIKGISNSAKIFKFVYLAIGVVTLIIFLTTLSNGSGLAGAGAIIFYGPILLGLIINAIVARILNAQQKRNYWAVLARSSILSFPVFFIFYFILLSDIKVVFGDSLGLGFLIIFILASVAGGILIKRK